MFLLIIGLLLFLGTHSINLVAPQWREQQVAKLGLLPWKGLIALVAILGFLLIIWGYGQARTVPNWLWVSPAWTRHLAALLMLPAFVFLVAAFLPGNKLKARLGHPLLLATKTWAIAHLLSNGTVAALLLFGGFLLWSVAAFVILRRRDRAAGRINAPGNTLSTVFTVILGVVLWAVFAMWLHSLLIGVAPFG